MALGSGSTTVAMTSIASSLGKLLIPSLRSGRQCRFAVYDGQNIFRNFSNGAHPINLMVNALCRVVLDQRIRLAVIRPESLVDQIFAIVRTMNQFATAPVANTAVGGHSAVNII